MDLLSFQQSDFSFAAGGFEYLPDEATLGLWHFDGGDLTDTSDNAVKGEVEGKAVWDENQKWNNEDKPGKSFVFDGNTVYRSVKRRCLYRKWRSQLKLGFTLRT